MFRTVFLSIIKSFSLYTHQDQDGTSVPSWSWSCSQAVSKHLWHIPLPCVQWKTHDDGQRNCPKHVEFYSENKFEKLVHLVCFIIRIYHDSRSPERIILYVCLVSSNSCRAPHYTVFCIPLLLPYSFVQRLPQHRLIWRTFSLWYCHGCSAVSLRSRKV